MAAGLDPRITDALALLPDYLGQHVILSISAVTLGIALGLPLAMAEDPLSSVVLGAGKMLSDFNLLRKISID